MSGPAWLRVADSHIELQEGKVIVFDDSFEHEACNESDNSRIVLVIDLWHPDLSDEEVKFLEFCNKCQMAAAKRIYNSRASNARGCSPSEEGVGDKVVEGGGLGLGLGLGLGNGGGEAVEDGEDFLSLILDTRKANIKIPDEQIWGYRVVDD